MDAKIKLRSTGFEIIESRQVNLLPKDLKFIYSTSTKSSLDLLLYAENTVNADVLYFHSPVAWDSVQLNCLTVLTVLRLTSW